MRKRPSSTKGVITGKPPIQVNNKQTARKNQNQIGKKGLKLGDCIGVVFAKTGKRKSIRWRKS